MKGSPKTALWLVLPLLRGWCPVPPDYTGSSAFLSQDAFLMDVDADDLNAMDEFDRLAEERYRRARDRDARATSYDRGVDAPW